MIKSNKEEGLTDQNPLMEGLREEKVPVNMREEGLQLQGDLIKDTTMKKDLIRPNKTDINHQEEAECLGAHRNQDLEIRVLQGSETQEEGNRHSLPEEHHLSLQEGLHHHTVSPDHRIIIRVDQESTEEDPIQTTGEMNQEEEEMAVELVPGVIPTPDTNHQPATATGKTVQISTNTVLLAVRPPTTLGHVLDILQITRSRSRAPLV